MFQNIESHNLHLCYIMSRHKIESILYTFMHQCHCWSLNLTSPRIMLPKKAREVIRRGSNKYLDRAVDNIWMPQSPTQNLLSSWSIKSLSTISQLIAPWRVVWMSRMGWGKRNRNGPNSTLDICIYITSPASRMCALPASLHSNKTSREGKNACQSGKAWLNWLKIRIEVENY